MVAKIQRASLMQIQLMELSFDQTEITWLHDGHAYHAAEAYFQI